MIKLSEYGNEEVQDDNEEIEEEQELDENISNNQEIKIEDFEPINNHNIELEGENFEPSYSIETDIHDFQFEIPNNITFKNTYEEFEPIHDEKNVLECRPPNINTSWIKAIINDPTLSTAEKIELLEQKKRKLWDNSELSISKRRRISKAIDGAISKLKGARGGMLDSSISPNRDAAGKHDISNLKDSQSSIDNKINNQDKFQSEQSEKQDLSGSNDKGKELEHKLKEKKEKDNYELEPENETEYINEISNNKDNFKEDIDFEPLLEEQENSHNNFNKIEFEPSNEGDVKSTLNINKTEKFYNQNVRETLNNHKIKLDENFQLEEIRNKIKQINWIEISNNWTINYRVNQYSGIKQIKLNPYQDCSKNNPLYKHKEWLERIYTDKNLNLNDKLIGKICGVNPTVIGRWRKKHQIQTKIRGDGWIDKRSGRIYVHVPKDYKHPELKPHKGVRLEHIYKMEKYLSKHPELEISRKCLIDGKYLKIGTEVHHVNFKPQDNRIENLWVYESKNKHAKGELTLYNTLKELIKSNQIQFKDGRYSINQNFDNSKPNLTESERNQHKDRHINYKDINLVKEEIKKIDWQAVSKDWTVQIKKNQFVQETISVNPMQECSEENPLYSHKEWVQQLFNDKRFNLTDSRLGKLCGISRDKARYWRDRVHKIKGKSEWGYERIVDKSDGRIWVKVPKDYGNPVVQKEDHHRRYMIEHRYIMEQYLAKHPELEISKKCLIDGKYLKTDAQVHHINLDYQDNRIDNLWVYESDKEHRKARNSLYNLANDLLTRKLIRFKDGKYYINY